MCEMGLYSIQLALDPHGAKCLWVEWHLFEGNSIMWGVKIKRSGKLLRLQLTYWVMPRLWPSSSVAWKLWKCRMFLQYVNLLIRTWNRVNYRAGSRESWAEPPELLHQWHSLRFGKQHRAQKGDLGEMAQAHPAPAGAKWLSAGAGPAWKPWELQAVLESAADCWELWGNDKGGSSSSSRASSNTAGQTFCWRVFLSYQVFIWILSTAFLRGGKKPARANPHPDNSICLIGSHVLFCLKLDFSKE